MGRDRVPLSACGLMVMIVPLGVIGGMDMGCFAMVRTGVVETDAYRHLLPYHHAYFGLWPIVIRALGA